MRLLTASILSLTLPVIHASLNATALTNQYFGNDAPWYLSRIPLFESSSSLLTDVYYYRWSIFRSHQRDLGSRGYISTEFLNDVGWQTNPWASLNDATGFHLLEGRWCRDRRFKEDYADFIFSAESNTRQFSETMAASVWAGYEVDGSEADVVKRLDEMMGVFDAWMDSYDSNQSLYWVEPLRDATEYTISSIDASGGLDGFTGGNAFRPSINSFQYANAKAISDIAALKGNMDGTVDTYSAKASSLKETVQSSLWNTTFAHFIDRFQVNNTYVRYGTPIRGRELVGYVPWTHDLPDDSTEYAEAWTHILNASELAGPHGLRTNEPSYEYYMRQYRYEGTAPECQWNGPVWPFQTTQVLTGLANFLDHYPVGASRDLITKADYIRLLEQYAQLHYNPSRAGILDIEEDYYPDTGSPIVGLKRSPHYFHSGYIDVILSGLVGIRPSASDVLEVNPLADASMMTYFRADSILYHGHTIAVQWDATGTRYGTQGLQVEIDGVTAATSPTLTRLTVPISRVAPPALQRRLAKSIQLNATTPYPIGSVSAPNASSLDAIHAAIDGRVFFFPEPDVANGWDTPVSTTNTTTTTPDGGSEFWFAIDFGAPTLVSSAELAFFLDLNQGFDVPVKYSVQVVQGEGSEEWVDVDEAVYGEVVGNGITHVSWKASSVGKIRVVFELREGVRARLVEMKIF
ncbi:hypothetical protein K504DRAFT_507701 [Pleomassaria siparia CBS 279.74]|uniref:Mannosylglycerate hydrolase MGH1-like glycoside hydrolase domain-containing protein n=1 Tax=Pleomassaria siparia CBS 279.74 TaxID=1314801 RepID=A0A6G1JU35_9PLEO|nr:hypothetical protein K504DRAFT_507701 [Pleomassaria siparia CBS 279.74]